ncbi:MAG TPA: hypothetical protein VFC21_04715 [Bryobacteraceae bacterium]|nr:hypothetical protein [Bryobacteraceae bacterium]
MAATNNPQDHKHDREHDREHAPNPQVSHERADINVLEITGFGIALVIGCIVVVFAMWALFAYLAKREDSRNTPIPVAMEQERQRVPPAPRLSGMIVEPNGSMSPRTTYPRIELKEMRDDEDAILNSYGWVDPNKGTVRIPIDQAIDMVARKGLPSKPSAAGSDNDGYRMIPSDASGGRTLEKISR